MSLAVSVAVILLVVVPWAGVHDHAHWSRVEWVPFTAPLRWRDIAVNLLLYLPFGFIHDCGRPRPSAWRTLAYACGLSVATELTQVFSHGRFPSATDVLSNVTGAAMGLWWSRLSMAALRSHAP